MVLIKKKNTLFYYIFRVRVMVKMKKNTEKIALSFLFWFDTKSSSEEGRVFWA